MAPGRTPLDTLRAILWLSLLSYANGQFNIRVGFQREEIVTSSYGNSKNDKSYRQMATTTLSPTIPFWPKATAAAKVRPLNNGRTQLYQQKRNSYFNQWMMDLNNNNYDKYTLPKLSEDAPVEVTVSMMIIRVHSLSDASMDYGIEVYYREQWNDYRLQFNRLDYDGLDELNLPVAVVNYIWKPDTYFLNAISAEVDSENSVTHKAFFRLRNNGDIHYSRKISLKADCPMDLTMYPFDVQSCKLKLGSYSSPSRDVAYKWVPKQGQDVEVKERIELAEFVAERLRTYNKTINYTTGSFDSLELCLTFKRRAGFCIMQVFFPATAVVMSSWVALWLAEDTTFSDVLAVILAIIFLAYAYNSVMPRVSYVKLLDLYMCSCFLFVFLSLAKLVIIKYFCHKWAKENNRSSDFFLDQLLGLSAVSNGADVEQANGDLANRDAGSRRSSSSLSSGEKKKLSRNNSKKANGQISRSSSIFRRKENGGFISPPASARRQERRRKSSLKNSDTADNDTQSETTANNEETTENLKNEELEVTSMLVQDETKLNVNDELPEENPEQVAAPVIPLAALFGNAGTTPTSNSANNTERRVTFFGMEAFSAWFEARHKKKGAARYMKYLRYFHVVTQLALPLAFGAFFVFLLLIYPNVPRAVDC